MTASVKHQILRGRRDTLLPFMAGLALIVNGDISHAATIGTGDVTSTLGPTFFVDDAVTGGSDVTVTQPAVPSYNRSFAGLLTPGMGQARVTLTGFGFATANTASDNTATSLSLTFTYLGADEAIGGGDDVAMGSATGTYSYSGSGEYVFAFDTPLTAQLNITGTRFQIQVAPSNATNNGKVRFKTAALTYETATGPKFSVAGFVSPQRVNLAEFQPVTTDSVNGQQLASYVTDGNAGNENRWQSSGSGPHWARVDFPFPVEVGSAQVFTGFDDINAQANFRIQYLDGASWVDVPGAVVAGNTDVERNIVFTTPVTAAAFRIYSTDGTLRIRELALYPPNGVSGYPLGTDVRLNPAQQRPVVSSANTSGNFALLAVDGRVNKDSMWQTSTAGTNTLDIDLIVSTKIGSAHLYSGSPGVAPLAAFDLKYWDSAAWQTIPGGSVTGNTTGDLVVSFSTPVTTTKVRLEFTNPGTASVRELCIFAANAGNTGYLIGTGVTGVPPSKAKADDYTDSFYQISNPAAGRFISVGNGGQPALDETGLNTAQGQYQILLNIGTGTYRLRNRATGNCLSGAQLSNTPGQPLTDAPYSALPHQDWILDPLDGGAFQLINQWSGLALDIQGGGTAAGTPLVQSTANGSASQSWQMVFSAGFPKKGVGGSNYAQPFNANWMYNWGLNATTSLPAGAVFQPMQWGNYNWTFNTSANSTWKLYPTWRSSSQSLHLLGFNEPDKYDQSGNSLDTENTDEMDFSTTRSMEKAVELWPRLEAMDLPLVAPCPANMTGGWLADFYTQANARGYRVDYTAVHSYPGPNGGSSDNLVNTLTTAYNNWGRPVWLTEFSFVSWSGTGTWTEEDNYNCLAEFLWRAESLPWLRKYALFVFTESDGGPNNPPSPAPALPWSTVGPRSNSIDINGNLTAFGELYAAWDNDAVVRPDKTYFIHNKGTRKRLASVTGQSPPGARTIRNDDKLVQWTLVASPVPDRYYIVSSLDGRRLSFVDGGSLTLAAADSTGSAVQWALTENQYGWFFIEHPASSKRLKLQYDNSTYTATYSMVANTNTGDAIQWRFIVTLPPPAWTGGSDDSWTNSDNWTPSAVPSAGDAVSFGAASAANLDTVLNQDFDLSGISLSDPAGPVSIGGANTLTLGSGGLDLAAATHDLTINAPLVLSAAQSWSVASGRALSLGGAVSGSHDITVIGAGKVSPGASNLLPNGAAAGDMIVNGTLDLNGTSQSINGLGGSGIIDNTNPGNGSLTIGNNDAVITLNTLLQNSNGTLALVKTGGGGLTLSGANSHSGGFTNNGTGSILPKDNASFGSGTVLMNGGTIYATGGNYTFSNPITLNGATLRVGGGAGKSVDWAGPVSITADSTIQCDGTTAGITLSGSVVINGFTLSSAPNGTTNTISGPVSGTGTIMASTFSNGILNLNAANSFSGSFRAALGTLNIGDALALQNGTVDMNAADSGTVNLNNLNATIGALTGSRNLSLGSGTVSIGNNNTHTTYSGVLSGSGSLVKTGNGSLTLSGANNYAGTTNVNSGVLALGGNNSLPDTALSIGNATLDTATFTDIVGTLDPTGTATINLGSGAALAFANSSGIDWTGGSLNITGDFTPGASIRFGATSGGLTPAQLALITVNGNTGPFALDAGGFLIIPVTDPYDIWKTQITNGLDLRFNDADGDGFLNIEEFLFGTSPVSGKGSMVTTTPSGGNLILRWLQRENGATYLLQQSTTLAAGSWTTVALPSPALDGDQSGAPADYDYFTVSLPTNAGSLFYRVKGVEN